MQKSESRLWMAATFALIAVAIAVRVAINFSGSYPPGVNAAYYSVQARHWIEHGRLMYDDLPLIFWLDAGLGRLLTLTGRPLHDAVLLATRIVDSVIEPVAALGIMALGFAWSDGRWKALPGCLAASAFVVLSPPILRMLSDFEKNSFGLALMCAALWACRSAMAAPSARAWLALVILLVLAAMTHIGAFAMTAAMIVVAIAVWAVGSARQERRLRGLGWAIAGGALLLALLAAFDSHRVVSLVRAPIALFLAGNVEWVQAPVVVVGGVLLLGAAIIAWRDRLVLGSGDIAIVTAAATALVVVALPKSYVYFDRLLLMAPVPIAVLLAFVVARSGRASLWLGTALLPIAIAVAVSAPSAVQPPFVTAETAGELTSIREQIAEPPATLVVAPHGLEWWAGHLLNTPVRSALPATGMSGYRRVLLLRNTIDCPHGEANPFAGPQIGPLGRKLYAGRCLELFELE